MSTISIYICTYINQPSNNLYYTYRMTIVNVYESKKRIIKHTIVMLIKYKLIMTCPHFCLEWLCNSTSYDELQNYNALSIARIQSYDILKRKLKAKYGLFCSSYKTHERYNAINYCYLIFKNILYIIYNYYEWRFTTKYR